MLRQLDPRGPHLARGAIEVEPGPAEHQHGGVGKLDRQRAVAEGDDLRSRLPRQGEDLERVGLTGFDLGGLAGRRLLQTCLQSRIARA